MKGRDRSRPFYLPADYQFTGRLFTFGRQLIRQFFLCIRFRHLILLLQDGG
jgi:hypothetical protein